MRKIIIAAIGPNSEIGYGLTLPWNKSNLDMNHFRETTVGHPIIMGRRTFHSIGQVLPNRLNIVISRLTSHISPCIDPTTGRKYFTVPNMQSAYDVAAKNTDVKCFIIGGGQIYRNSLDDVDELIITKMPKNKINPNMDDATVITFPDIDDTKWRATVVNEVSDPDDMTNSLTIITYTRLHENLQRPS